MHSEHNYQEYSQDPLNILELHQEVFGEHRALRAHHRNLGIRPRKVHVAAQVFGRHHVVGADRKSVV